MRKKTHTEVEQAIAAKGHRLLSATYENSRKNLDILCPKGHTYKMDWAHFNGGRKCGLCIVDAEKNDGLAMVQKAFSDAGYTLLAEKYDRNSTRMNCICNEGHQIKMDWASFQDGIRCIECSKVTRGKTKKHNTHLKAKTAFLSEGYQLLDEYTDSHTPMRFICPIGHNSQMSWTNFDSGSRCAYCMRDRLSKDQKEINAIKDRVAGSVRTYLRKQEAQKPFSVSRFSSEIAKMIYKVLGNKPDDHHLDHIIPQSFFDFRKQDEIEACWNIDNLRYIPATENMAKGHKLSLKDVEAFSLIQLGLLVKASRKPHIFNVLFKDVGTASNVDSSLTKRKVELNHRVIQLSLWS